MVKVAQYAQACVRKSQLYAETNSWKNCPLTVVLQTLTHEDGTAIGLDTEDNIVAAAMH